MANPPTTEESLENIKWSHITAKIFVPDTHHAGEWLHKVYTITSENNKILKELAPIKPGDDPITGILLLLKISMVLTTSWSALSTCIFEGFPALLDPAFLLMKGSSFMQWRPELSERLLPTNSIPAFICLYDSGVPMGKI